MKAEDANGSLDGVAIGTTDPTPVSPLSTATTTVPTGTPTTGAVPLLLSPDSQPQPAADSAQHTKGSFSHGASAPENSHTDPLPAAEGDQLFSQMIDFRTIHDAWKRARSGKRDTYAVQQFGYDLESNLIQLQNDLIWQQWTPGPYEHFQVFEPKLRDIYAPAFRDRVVHHLLFKALTPVFEARFHGRSYACRVGKGTHAAINKAHGLLRRYVRSGATAYCLKADIAKYFHSIDHSVLKKLIRRRVTCPKVLHLTDLIIDTGQVDTGAPVGIPLGNLTSQLFANIYLHELDHHLAVLHPTAQYVRYMDDFLVIAPDISQLKEILSECSTFLAEKLRLKLNPKTTIFPISRTNGRSIDFLGFRLHPAHRRLRRKSVIKGRDLASAFSSDPTPHNLERLTSWYNHASYARPQGLMREIFQRLANSNPNPIHNS